MIAGFQQPDAGRILIGDSDVTGCGRNRRDIGFVFQNYALFPHLSVFENVAYGLRVKRLSGRRHRRAVERGAARWSALPVYEPQIPDSSPAASSSASRWRARS